MAKTVAEQAKAEKMNALLKEREAEEKAETAAGEARSAAEREKRKHSKRIGELNAEIAKLATS